VRVLLACGGTGGHIFPAFSVAEEIRRRRPDARIVYVCGTRDIESEIFALVKGERVERIESAPFRGRRSLWSARFLLKLLAGFRQARAILRRERPDVVVGFGGHYSFPIVAAARLAGVPTLIHEQNVVPGVANKFLMRWVDGAALSFEETRPRLPKHRNMRVTGNPIRASIERDCREEALRSFGFSPDRLTLLVLGGSQGAESINTLFLGALPFLSRGLKDRLQVLHLCGRMEPAEVQAAARDEGVNLRAFSFFDRMDLAYGAADLAVGRAGATFLAEITAKHLPAILIPYPFAGAHQLENARAFGRTGDATILEQGGLKPERLAERIEEKAGRLRPLRGSGPSAAPPSARVKLADFIEEMARH